MTVLIISFSDLQRDPRVNRQIQWLTSNYKVIAAGYGKPQSDVEFVDIQAVPKNLIDKLIGGIKLLSGKYESYYWKHPNTAAALKKLSNIYADVIIANDIDTLPLALQMTQGKGVIFDAHEYAPEEFEDLFVWRTFYKNYKFYLCSRYLNQAYKMFTVGRGISEAYCKNFGIKTAILDNAGEYVDLQPSVALSDKIRLVSHGYACPSRKLEEMIEMFAYLDKRFELDFFLLPFDSPYSNKLRKMAQKYPQVRFLRPVPMMKIVKTINAYDMGIFLLPPSNCNYANALPNKFFEFIQARLAIAIGPTPEMAAIVKRYECGIVSPDFSALSLARKLTSLTAYDVDRMKKNSCKAAQELSSQKNCHLLMNAVQSALEEI